MIALAICLGALVVSYCAGRVKMSYGLLAVLTVGYFYGILRANVLHPASHFIFDCSLIGFYLSQHNWFSHSPRESVRLGGLHMWAAVLVAWPFLIALLPFQPWMVTLVGLRGIVLFLPMILVGAWLKDTDVRTVSMGLAMLNLIAFAFACAEYFTSVTQFYPKSAVTTIIYISTDGSGTHNRIPAIFSSAHAYGGSMVATLPFLIGLCTATQLRRVQFLAIASIVGSMFGVLMSSTRLNFVLASAMVCSLIFAGRISMKYRMGFALMVAALGVTAMTNVRFQRLKSLGDTEFVSDRIAGSVNRRFLEILVTKPMGNGLGGGGTSMPYFLQNQVRNPIGMENEYARILCEEGVIGLVLWAGFIAWFLSRIGVAFAPSAWSSSRRLAWFYCAILFGTSFIGTGTLASIPGTALFLLSLGWCSTKPVPVNTRTKPSLAAFRYRADPVTLG